MNLNWVIAALIVAAAFGGIGGYLFATWHEENREASLNSIPSRSVDSVETISTPTPAPTIAETVAPTPETTPTQEPSPAAQPTVSPQNPSSANETAVVPPANASNALMIPVVGIKKNDLQDTFTAARSGGRVHDANDIMAQCGAIVIAAVDGEIARFFDSVPGGITIYQRSADKRLMYYYAHLQRRADGIQPGQFVKRGTLIGYVGDTGNAGAGNCHLHFAIWTIDNPKRDWDGTNINPYPLLKDGIESPSTR